MDASNNQLILEDQLRDEDFEAQIESPGKFQDKVFQKKKKVSIKQVSDESYITINSDYNDQKHVDLRTNKKLI